MIIELLKQNYHGGISRWSCRITIEEWTARLSYLSKYGSLVFFSSWWVLFCLPVHVIIFFSPVTTTFLPDSSFSCPSAGKILLNLIPQENKTYGISLSPAVENNFQIFLAGVKPI